MARFTIYSPTGTALYTGTPSFTGQYMKPGLLEFREVSVPTLLALEPGCYVDYDRTGYRYRIYTVPQIKKQARRATYGGAFVFQGVQLYDASKQLEYCLFRDLVKGGNRIHFSTQPSISTFEGVDGLARRFEACLRDQYDVNGVQSWAVRVATVADDGISQETANLMAEAREFTVSGLNILECLDKIYEIWPGIGWIYNVENSVDTIVIGGGGASSNVGNYSYGKGNGLTSLTRVAANADEIANRIFAYGSSRNMLPRWYNNQSIKNAASVDIQNLMIPVSSWGLTDNLPDPAKAFIEDATSIAKNGLRPATVYFDGSGEYPEIYPTLRGATIGAVRTALGSSSAKYYPSTTVYTDATARVDALKAAQSTFDSGKAGADGKDAILSDHDDISATASGQVPAAAGLGQKMYATPFLTKDITISENGEQTISVNISLSGTITTSLGYMGMSIRFYTVANGAETLIGESIREIAADSAGTRTLSGAYASVRQTLASGSTVRVKAGFVFAKLSSSDPTAFSYSVTGQATEKVAFYRAKTFTVTLRQIGFDIDEQAALGDGKTISMRSGDCVGRSFAIISAQYQSATDDWLLECYRTEDESLSQWFPNTDYKVKAGDEFVLLDIAMPDIYVQMAEQRLLTEAQGLLADAATERWQYTPEIDAKFMIENSRTIVAGQNMTLADEDIIGESAVSALVDTVTINEGESAIPTYKVTLRDRKRKTWTESEGAPSSSSKSVGTVAEAQQTTQNIDLSGYVKNETFDDLASRVTALEGESFFTLDSNGNVTLKAAYSNLWVPGWMAEGGIGSGGGGGGGVDLDRVWQSLTNNTDKPNVKINLAHIPDITTSKITDLETWITNKGYITSAGIPDESTVEGWGFTKNAGTVTSVTLTQGTGITITNSGTAITSSGTRTIGINSTYQTYIQHGESAYNNLSNYVQTTRKINGADLSQDRTLYLGTTTLQTASQAQAVTGLSSFKLSSAESLVEWDSDYDAWRFHGNLIAEGWVAEGGVGSSASGGVDLDRMWASLTNTISDTYANTKINAAHLPASLKNPYALTFGSKTYDGSAAKTITASDLGALTAHQAVTLASGTNNGTLKLTVGSTVTDNIAVNGLGSLAYKSSLVAADIPDISGTYLKLTGGTMAGAITMNGANILTAADSTNQIGSVTNRFGNGFFRNLYTTYFGFRDGNNGGTQWGHIGCGDGYMSLYLENGNGGVYGQYVFNSDYGFFHGGNGDVPCGRSDHRWSYVYGVNADLTGDLGIAGSITPAADITSYLGSNSRRFHSGSIVNVYTRNINFKHQTTGKTDGLIAGGYGYLRFRTGADIDTAYKDIVFHETYGFYPEQSGVNLGYGSAAQYRWSNIYGVNADLSGNLALARTSTITIGPVTITYDSTNKALHIYGTDNGQTIGLYCDGWMAEGGVAQTT